MGALPSDTKNNLKEQRKVVNVITPRSGNHLPKVVNLVHLPKEIDNEESEKTKEPKKKRNEEEEHSEAVKKDELKKEKLLEYVPSPLILRQL